MTKKTYEPGEGISGTTIFSPHCAGAYDLFFACDIPASVKQSEKLATDEIVSNEDVWHGRFVSNEVTIHAVEPQGVDARAYEECNHHPLFSTYWETLMLRFPSSTYTAYLVWSKTYPAFIPSMVADCVYSTSKGGIGSFPPGSLPCGDPGTQKCGGARPNGTQAARRQVAWIDVVLEHHPDIWFADELRFERAYAAFHLGDENGFISAMDHLSKKGKPYVGDKARELLAALREKGLIQDPETAEGSGQ
jgi:hypothetical protein